MFRISIAQIQRLSSEARSAFSETMESYLRRYFVHLFDEPSGESIRKAVAVALHKCSNYDITIEPEAAQLIVLLVTLGLDVDEKSPSIRTILSDGLLLPIGKLRKLVEYCNEHGTDVSAAIFHPDLVHGGHSR